MKNTLLYNWTFSRILWITIGMVIVTEAIVRMDLVTGIAGLIYTGMGVFNKRNMFIFSPKGQKTDQRQRYKSN